MGEPIEETVSPWMPEQNRITLALLGKLIEECNELAGRAARCIIQGVNEHDPESKRTNHDELAREIADVEACIQMVRRIMHVPAMEERRLGKMRGFNRWHKMIFEEATRVADKAGEKSNG